MTFVLKASADVCVDSVASDGTRYLYCSYENTNTTDDNGINLMAISCKANKTDTTYMLSFILTQKYVFYSVPNKGKAYIKDVEGSIDSLVSVSSFGQHFLGNISEISPKYIIPKSAIPLIGKGVVKIRLELSKGYYDIEAENFNTEALQKQILDIERYLNGLKPKVDLLKGF